MFYKFIVILLANIIIRVDFVTDNIVAIEY